LRTNWSAEARISSSVAGGSKFARVRIFRHMEIGGIGGIGFRQRAPGDQVLLCCTVEGTTTLPRPATR
jgi:hypothetical protein